MQNLNQSLNETLQGKYPHLQVSVFNFKKISTHLIFGSEFNSNTRETALQTLNLNSNKTINDYFDLINTTISSVKEPVYVYDLTHSLGNFMCDVELSSENLGSNKKEALAEDFVISRLRSYLQEMAVIQPKDFRQLLSTEYLVYRAKTDSLSANTLMVFALTKEVQTILNYSQYGTEHPRFYEFVFNEMPIPNALLELDNEIDLMMKKAYQILESSKIFYKEAESLLYWALGLDSSNPLKSLQSAESSLRASEESAAIYKIGTKDNVDCHDLTSSNFAMTKADSPNSSLRGSGEATTKQSINQNIDCHEVALKSATSRNDTVACHTERSEVSQKYPHLNISIRSLSASYGISGRLDSEYYQAKYDAIECKIRGFSHKKLGDLVTIQKSIEPGSEAYQDEGIEFVRVANLSKFGISKSDICLSEQDFGKDLEKLAPKKETILLSKDGSIGISYCLEEDLECITSGAILHLKVKDKSEILPQALSLILNSIAVKLQAERDSGGSIIAHWKISEIENVLIPLLDFKLQEQIAQKIQKSFALRKESKDLLESAKAKVENTIENEGKNA